MGRSFALSLLVLVAGYSGALLTARAIFAQEEGSADAKGEVPQTTEVGGEVPEEFLGRWVAFSHVKLPSGLVRHFARLWEVRRGDEHYELFLYQSRVPPEVSKKLDDATAAGEEWEASPEDIQQVSDHWEQLAQTGSLHAKIENKLLAGDSYPPEFKRDAVTKGSEFSFVFNEVFSGKQSITRTYSIYAVRSRGPDRVSGSFITTSMAVAPFPIPITLKGDYEAYRVGKPPPPGLIQRVLDIFSGCGGS